MMRKPALIVAVLACLAAAPVLARRTVFWTIAPTSGPTPRSGRRIARTSRQASPRATRPSGAAGVEMIARSRAGRAAPAIFGFLCAVAVLVAFLLPERGASRSRRQCASGANPGFVVHGLWPQYARGYPSDCRADGFVSGSALARTRGLYPDEGLARYEWRKHGTCSGKDPIGYFADVRAAYDSVTVPSAFSAPQQDQNLRRSDIQRAFIDANPRLRPGMMAVACQRGAFAGGADLPEPGSARFCRLS